MPCKDTGHTQNLVVALRVRPLSSAEFGEAEIIHVLDENLLVLRDPNEDQDDILRVNRSREKQYVFDHAFGPNSSQVDVFSATTKPLISNVTSGYNATVFAYGATGAGKTYTMLGNDNKLGIMGLTLNDLFAEMELTKEDVKYKVTMSYLEIYNEMIRDLLNPSTGILELREDSKGVNVAGLSEVEARTTSEVMGMLLMGNKQRTSEPTAANKTSSRSHAVLQVTVKQKSRVENVIQEVKVGKLFMIDLAGSERAAQTKNRGKRMIEGAHINRSLLALGNCINALSENRGHYVNFRDSKLTRLLKDSLGGNCRTVMIAHVSPAAKGFEESRNTLLYADRAKNIKTTIKKNQFNVSYHIAQYTNIISDLRKEVFRLKTKIAEQSVSEMDSNKASIEASEHHKNKDHTEMNKIRNQLVSTFREQMEIRHKLMELEDMAMQIALDTNRYMMVIDGWDQEKARRALKKAETEKQRNERKAEKTLVYHDNDSSTLVDKNGRSLWTGEKEKGSSENLLEGSSSYGDDECKDLDTEKDRKIEVAVQESEPFSMVEPEEVTFAREEINNLVAEGKRVSEMKASLQNKMQQTREEVERLEEQLPKKISSEENREILSLICKVHELEITNAELQSQALLRENVLRNKDLEVNKYESRQKLCDEIIQKQRAIISDAQLNCSSELEGLYEVYRQQSFDTDERDSVHSESTTSNSGPSVSVNRAAVLAGINRRRISRDNIFAFTSKLSPLTEETPSRLVSLQNSPIKTSHPTPSAYNTLMEYSTAETRPTSPVHTPKYRSRVSSPEDLSMRSSFFLTTPKKPNNDNENFEAFTPVFSRTQNFSELSICHRMMTETQFSSDGSLREGVSPSKMSPLASVRERPMASVSDTSLGINSNKQAVKPSLSLGDLSMIDKKASDQGSVDSVPVNRRPAKKGKRGQEKKSTPTRPTRRQRSASLDDANVHKVKPRKTRKGYQEVSKFLSKQHQFPNKTRERASLRLEGTSPVVNATNSKRSRIPMAPVKSTDVPQGVTRNKGTKYPRGQRSDFQDGELQSFLTNVTPPSTVRQIGTPHGKGLKIQKRYRVPSDITGSDSNQSTPNLKQRKQQVGGNSSVDALSVSGVAMRPTKQYAGIRRF